MAKTSEKTSRRTARHARIRANVQGTAERPRLAVFKSNRATYAQLINDEAGNTIAAADTRASKAKTATERAAEVGTQIAELAKKANITEVVFDRGGFKYQGGIAALADNARAGGLKF